MTSKVLWGEGLLLRPQHFQRQDHYHEQCLHKSIKAVHPYAWGVDNLQVDRAALANSVLRLLALSVRFQDGDWVDAPEVDALHGEAFAAGTERMRVDFGLETNIERRFALWTLMHILGVAPDLDVAFKDEATRNAARDFMDLFDRASEPRD